MCSACLYMSGYDNIAHVGSAIKMCKQLMYVHIQHRPIYTIIMIMTVSFVAIVLFPCIQ